ncbi:MAG: MFS transporter [Methanomassiliicoccales archaeon]
MLGSGKFSEKDVEVRSGWKRYHTLWVYLFMAWMFCYIDRSITGPVVSWMIRNHVSFLADSPMPFAIGGIIGSMFFAGYMLTQFPAGYLGDKYGRKVMLVISTAWSGIFTGITALSNSLTIFVSTRVATGLGEGAYYSNDRAMVSAETPAGKRSMGMGIVFVGLGAGLTIATVFTPYILDASAGALGKDAAWTVPFVVFSGPTLLVSYLLYRFKGKERPAKGAYRRASIGLGVTSAVIFVSIMAIYLLTVQLGLSSILQAVAVGSLAVVVLAVIVKGSGKAIDPTILDRDLMLMYVSAIPILYTLWFFGFWATMVVSEAADLGLSGAALYAGFFGLANIIGYPLGGKVGDRLSPLGRKRAYVISCSLLVLLVTLLALCLSSADLDLVLLTSLIFAIGVTFAAMQTLHMTLTADLSPPGLMGQTFGMWNLTAEFGALLSPVISGTLRDVTGDWTLAILLDAALLGVSALLVLAVGRRRRSPEASANS